MSINLRSHVKQLFMCFIQALLYSNVVTSVYCRDVVNVISNCSYIVFFEIVIKVYISILTDNQKKVESEIIRNAAFNLIIM